MFTVELTKNSQKQLAKLTKDFQVRIRSSIAVLTIHPLAGKPLVGEYKGLYSLRVWPYRIIYKILKQKLIIEVIDIKHRQSAYSK